MTAIEIIHFISFPCVRRLYSVYEIVDMYFSLSHGI